MTKIPGTPEQLLARRKWVDALRNGNYQQGTGRLKRDNQFCCLGVACEVSELGGWGLSPDWPGAAYVIDKARPGTHSLPGPVAEQLGIDPVGCFKPGDIELWQLNDREKWTFSQIADLIEEKWEVAPTT